MRAKSNRRYSERERNAAAELARRELARRSLIDFTRYTSPAYSVNWHHREYAQKLDAFARGEISRLMVFMPPQHGKSELCSRRLPAKLLGDDSDLRIGLISYNHDFAAKFNRDVQRIIDAPEYHNLYPNTLLNRQNIRTVVGSWLRNADEFEVVGRRGGLVSVGTGGGLTGRAIDVLVIDDPYKDQTEAWSPTIRCRVQDWYDTVANTRLHNESRQLITLTRWHPDDLAGVLLARNPEKWKVVRFTAIRDDEPCEYDPREKGEALWPERHSLERLLEAKRNNPHVFQSLYQQDPKPAEGLLFPAESLMRFRMEELPVRKPDAVFAIADVADKGKDYYCMLVAYRYDRDLYIVDVIFTQAQTEITEPLTIGMLEQWQVQRFRPESNNGGRLFAKAVREKIQGYTVIDEVTTTANKETRILTASGAIKRYVHFRSDINPEGDYQKYMDQLCGYALQGRNEHDDAPDGTAMLVEAASVNSSDYSLTFI